MKQIYILYLVLLLVFGLAAKTGWDGGTSAEATAVFWLLILIVTSTGYIAGCGLAALGRLIHG